MRFDSPDVFLNALPEPAALLDQGGQILSVNRSWANVGVEHALAGGGCGVGCDYLARCTEFRAAASEEGLLSGIRGILDGRSQSFRFQYTCNGAATPHSFELVANALSSGGQSGALLLHYDVTEKKRIEAAYRQCEERLRHVLEMLPEGYWDWNLLTDEVFYADRWGESLGYSSSEIEPHVSAWLRLLHPDDVERATSAVKEYLEGRAPVYRCETRTRMKSGKYRWNLDRGRIVERDANGKPTRLVGMEVDITDRIEAEQVIREQSRRLRDLSTPLIPINDQVVVMPLIGTVDAQRAEQVLSTLLSGLTQSRASVAILDITGVSQMDASVAAALANAARAVQLLGAQAILTGVRPEVAMILVKLDIAWDKIVMRSTLQAGIAYATSVERQNTGPMRPAR